MHINYRDTSTSSSFDFDIAIIGAGAAGMTLALELSSLKNLSIGVIESGDFQFEQETQNLYNINVTGVPYYEPDGNRLRYFGGSTNHWARQIVPIEENVFTERESTGDLAWPFSKAFLSNYYIKAYQLLGFDTDTSLNFQPETLFPQEPWINFKPKTFRNTLRYVPKINLPEKFLQGSLNQANLTVVLNANVTDLVLSNNGKRLQKCDLSTLDGMKRGFATAKVFVLACGGIENPRLLLLSNKQEPAGVGNQSGLVGKYFMEHPHILKAATLYGKNDTLASYGYHEVNDMGYVRSIELTPDYQEHHRLLSISLTWLPIQQDDYAKRHGLNQYQLGVQSEQRPNLESNITLAEEKDSLGLPKSNLKWQVDDTDSRTISKAIELFASELGRLGLARVKYEHVNPDADIQVTHWQGGAHHMGTTRMSGSPSRGVVDHNLKVHGIDNMYIAGSSVFPTVGYANPTLTILALTYRLADHLKNIHIHL